jgi:hypothetical protein
MPAYFSSTTRRRLAPVVLVTGLVVVGAYANREVPREQEVRFELDERHERAKSIRIAYMEAGEQLSGVDFRLTQSPRRVLVHHPSLKPGQYDVVITIESTEGAIQRLTRKLSVPAEGVRYRLTDTEGP